MEQFVHAIAGASGGMLAMAPLYPLDQIRTIQQVEGLQVSSKNARYGLLGVLMDVVSERGWSAIYKGHTSLQFALGSSNFIYFYCYNGLKSLYVNNYLPDRNPLTLSPVASLTLSCISGVVNVFATAPLWVVNMRLKSDNESKYNGIYDCFREIIRQEGVAALWDGTIPSLVLVSNPIIHYCTYEYLKTEISKRRVGKLIGFTALEYFLMGAFAKAVATVATYPLQVAQSKLRAKQFKYSGMIACLIITHREYGLKGLYAGLKAKLVQTVLTAAFTLVAYEKIVQYIRQLLMLTKL